MTEPLSYQAEWNSLTPGEQGHTLPILLSHAEVRALTQASPALRTLYATAARPEHILALKASDLQQQGVHIDGRWHPLDRHTAATLQLLALTRPQHLFEPHQWLETLNQSPVAKRYQAVGRSLTPMALRHAAATHLLEGPDGHDGAHLRPAQEVLGHASLATAQRYTGVTTRAMQDALRRGHPRG